MDKTDSAIIDMLKQNSRASFIAMGKKLNMTEGAVRYRVNSLVSKGIIKRFTIETGASGINAAIRVRTVYKQDMKKIVSALLKIKGVDRVFETSGDFDLVVHTYSFSTGELNKIIDSIRTIKGVVSTVSYLILQEHEK